MIARALSLLRRSRVYAASRVIAQGAPFDGVDTAPTLTIANLLTKIVVGTPTAGRAYTVPTGTLVEGGTDLLVGESFDWSVANLTAATHAITITAGTDHTLVGAVIVAALSSGAFRTRKTDLNTFVTYRIG